MFEALISKIPLILSVVILSPILIILSDKILNVCEKLWENISYEVYEPAVDEVDAFSEFAGLDENILQITSDTNVTFLDVAGNEEAKKELREVVEFLIDPESFARLGANVPKGVLLGGPPGTGKTLLAKAIAGEARTPFLKIAGSQFVELLVGVGASRVRELFEKARDLEPSIIFIDEIDSIARARSASSSMGGGNDEREQTLNQILTEMDGFEANTGVVVVAATNRIDVLDPAIKRAGRFDRQITINNPNLKERIAILNVHARGKKLDESVAISQIAQRTIGFSGADLANLLNEAAILATRLKKSTITMKDINLSIDRIVIGLEGRQVARVKARQLTAYHEMGHAFVASLIDENNGIEKLTLVPRGNTQGTTWTTPSLSQYNSRHIFVNQVLTALGGRAAEEMVGGIGECTVGAQQDIADMTRVVRTMVLRYAMAKLQELKQEAQQRNLFFLGTDVKQELNNIIDNFTTNFMDIAYNEVVSFLEVIRPGGERLVDELMISEELSGKDLRTLAREYLSSIVNSESLYTTRQGNLFALVSPDVKKDPIYKKPAPALAALRASLLEQEMAPTNSNILMKIIKAPARFIKARWQQFRKKIKR
jgi:cell division protease FtsH